jgi:hypothetical protein
VASLLLAPQVALVEAGVPVVPALDARVLDRTGTRAALAYLRIGADPDAVSGADVVEVYRRPTRGLPGWITKWFERCRSIAEVRAVAARVDDAKVAAKVLDVAADLDTVAAAVRGGSTRDVLVAIRDRVGLGSAMDLLDTSKGGQTASQLDDLEALVQVAALHPDPRSFEPWLRDLLTRRDRAQGEGVTLATVHRVKGQEWDHVAVFGVTDGLLPHRLADDVEEERRVLHVAITRGRRRVAVFADAERPSELLDELAGTRSRSEPAAPRRTAAARRAATAATGAGGGTGGGGRAGGAARAARWVEAEPGLAVVATGGIAGTVRAADRDGVLVEVPGGGALRVRPGESVLHEGKEAMLVPPGTAALRAALAAWRTERYKADQVPPYVVASDKVLDALALARPTTAGELLAISGIGQGKVDAYGDDILAVVAAATG